MTWVRWGSKRQRVRGMLPEWIHRRRVGFRGSRSGLVRCVLDLLGWVSPPAFMSSRCLRCGRGRVGGSAAEVASLGQRGAELVGVERTGDRGVRDGIGAEPKVAQTGEDAGCDGVTFGFRKSSIRVRGNAMSDIGES